MNNRDLRKKHEAINNITNAKMYIIDMLYTDCIGEPEKARKLYDKINSLLDNAISELFTQGE